MDWRTLITLISLWVWWNHWGLVWGISSTRPYYYGVHLATNLVSNGTDLIISIAWRFTWSSQNQPSNEYLYNLCYNGVPCPSGSQNIRATSQNAYCTMPGTSFDGTTYVPWVGISSELYYPLSAIPDNYSSIDIFVTDRDWGLVPIYTPSFAFWGALTIIMISHRTDNITFNNSPRSTLTAIVVLYPGCGGWNFTIPTTDPDGDVVQCRWSVGTGECNYCCQQSQVKYPGGYPFALSNDCVLTYTGNLESSSVNFAVCIQLEDYYASDWANYTAALIAANGKNQMVTPPQPLSSASLQFIVKISPNTISPCVAVSPLLTDPCIISCTQSISSLVPQSVVPSSYSNSVNSTVLLNCSNGYYANPSSLSVTCVQVNSTSAQWVANGKCSSMGCTVFVTTTGSSTSTTVAALPATTTLNSSALPGWAIGLIAAVAVLGALALAALLAATVATVMWILRRGCFAPGLKTDAQQMTDVAQSENPQRSKGLLPRVVRRTAPLIMFTRSSRYT